LVEDHNQQHERSDTVCDGAEITDARGFAEICPESWKPEISLADGENLSSHQEEPPAGPAHHAVPNEADRRKRQLDRCEPQDPASLEDSAGFAKLVGHGAERLVPREGEIPDLTRKNQDDGCQLRRERLRQDGSQAKQDDGQERQYRDTLKDIEEREEHTLCAPIERGVMTINERERQRKCVRRRHSRE
jgi:hypothetical protein